MKEKKQRKNKEPSQSFVVVAFIYTLFILFIYFIIFSRILTSSPALHLAILWEPKNTNTPNINDTPRHPGRQTIPTRSISGRAHFLSCLGGMQQRKQSWAGMDRCSLISALLLSSLLLVHVPRLELCVKDHDHCCLPPTRMLHIFLLTHHPPFSFPAQAKA